MTKKMKMIAAAAAAVLTLAACGSDSDSADTTMAPDTTMAAEAPGTIVEVAQANPDFSTLVAAVTAAGLGETLSGEGPFTVFAPTNAAFEALPEGLLEKLLLPENKDTLVKILTYHVVGAKVMAADVAAGDVTTVEGSTFAVTTDGGVTINGDTTVTATDVEASNGVIHVIDKVIVPPTVDVAAL
ncbi:MAG: fasciclin domain-containing protein [Ilumatobacteraceae bacterium]